MKATVLTILTALLIVSVAPAGAQSLAASDPAKEFIYVGGSLVATRLDGNHPPELVSVTPGSGSGVRQLFAYEVSDPDGYDDIASVQPLIGPVVQGADSCWIYFARSTESIYLRNDGNNAWHGPIAAGQPTTLENTQCKLYPATSSISGSGDTLTAYIDVEFKTAYQGVNNTYGFTHDVGGLLDPWTLMGSWTVPAPGNIAPTADSVSPSSGSGYPQTFTFTYTDGNGYTDLVATSVIINNLSSYSTRCYLYYGFNSDNIYLRNDDNTAWFGPVPLGSANTLENSRCTIDASTSSSSGAGSQLTLTLDLTFKAAFAGDKEVRSSAYDGIVASSWANLGLWTVP